MRQYRLLSPMIKVVIVLFSLLFSTAQAGLVIGGTRFAYPENQSSISVELKNTSDRDMLVKVAVSPDDARQLTGTVESLPSYSETVFIATPGNDSNLLIVFYVQIMPDDFVMQLHRF